FDRLGLIAYAATAGDEDKVMEAALESGAEDVSSSDDGHEIWTAVENLHEVAKALEPLLGEPESVKLAWRPQITVTVDDESTAQTLIKLIDALEDDDDVQTVWGNYEVSDAIMEKLG
ncbi:MAG: YebC/PmpR family DNA-binding transcriptional regulator, partial [Sphingopyxis sp.]